MPGIPGPTALRSKSQGVPVIVMSSALVYYAVAGAGGHSFRVSQDPLKKSVAGLMRGTALLTFTCFGANAVIELGGEIFDHGCLCGARLWLSDPAGTHAAALMMEKQNIGLDPWYSAKAYAAVLDYCRRSPGHGEPVLFWHTYNAVDLCTRAEAVSPVRFSKKVGDVRLQPEVTADS